MACIPASTSSDFAVRLVNNLTLQQVKMNVCVPTAKDAAYAVTTKKKVGEKPILEKIQLPYKSLAQFLVLPTEKKMDSSRTERLASSNMTFQRLWQKCFKACPGP